VLFYPITKKEFEKETDFNKFAKEQINNDKKFINYFKNY
jgi:hypothetical protein